MLQKLCKILKFPHQEIRWNFGLYLVKDPVLSPSHLNLFAFAKMMFYLSHYGCLSHDGAVPNKIEDKILKVDQD